MRRLLAARHSGLAQRKCLLSRQHSRAGSGAAQISHRLSPSSYRSFLLRAPLRMSIPPSLRALVGVNQAEHVPAVKPRLAAQLDFLQLAGCDEPSHVLRADVERSDDLVEVHQIPPK